MNYVHNKDDHRNKNSHNSAHPKHKISNLASQRMDKFFQVFKLLFYTFVFFMSLPAQAENLLGHIEE